MSKFLDFFKPRVGVLVFSLVAIMWQYFYSFTEYNQGYFKVLREYLNFAFNFVNWQNGFVRALSLGMIWIIVAFVIFISLLMTESVSIFFYNRKIRSEFVNQSHEDFAHLLKKRSIRFRRHFPIYTLFSAAILVYTVSLLGLTDFMEFLRVSVIEKYLVSLSSQVNLLEKYSALPMIISFLVVFMIWYVIGCLGSFLFRKSGELHDNEKFEEEHFAPVINELS